MQQAQNYEAPRSYPQPFVVQHLNVLHNNNPYFNPILQSAKRFQQIIKSILESEADVFALNQVNPYFYSLLQQTPILEQKYPYISKLKNQKRGHCVLVLSKHEFTPIVHQESLLILELQPFNKPITIVAAHLTAYEDRMAQRKHQLAKIKKTIEQKMSQPARKNVILMGDLNLHLISETQMIYDLGLVDCWFQCNSHDPGYTWDPKENTLIGNFLPFDNRRMRLDRIAVSNYSNFDISSIQLTHNQKLPGSRYLFASDHFGLKAKLSFTPNISYSYDHEDKLRICRDVHETGFMHMQQIMRLRKLAAASALLVVILIISMLL